MQNKIIRNVVIVGGGTAGWMAAATLANTLRDDGARITLIDSSEIDSVGVGEATLPTIRGFNHSLGIDELDFIRKTKATFKLGIQFENWRESGHRYFHPFSGYGASLNGVDFHHYWLKAQQAGLSYPLSDFCLATAMAEQHKFAQPPGSDGSPLTDFAYAFHFDAALYAAYLRDYALSAGVVELKATVTGVELDSNTGFLQSLKLKGVDKESVTQNLVGEDQRIPGDLFIDCSGFRGVLISEVAEQRFEVWSEWLPCDRRY